MNANLSDLNAFLAVARAGGFRDVPAQAAQAPPDSAKP
jgi:hypothetical protein